MSRRLRAAAVAAALAALSLAAPASSSPGGGSLTVHASRSGYVVWSVPSGTSVDLHTSTATGTGSYAGYYLQPEAGGPVEGLGYVWLTAFREQGFQRFPMPLNAPPQPPANAGGIRHWKLAPGRYRVHVLGDAATRVRLVFSGRARGGTRAVAAPTSVVATTAEPPDLLPASGVPTPDVAITHQPMTVRENSLSFVAVFTRFRGVVADGSLRHACIGRSPQLRCATDPSSDTPFKHWEAHLAWPHNHSVLATAWYYHPGTLSPGEQTARFEVAAATGLERVVVASFSVAF